MSKHPANWSWQDGERDPGMQPISRPKDYRPAIPARVKFEVLIRQEGRCHCGCGEKLEGIDTTDFDHDPALVNRPWNEWEGDTVPPANDPAHLFAKKRVHHQTKTKKDIKTRDKSRRLVASNAEHKAKMAAKTQETLAASDAKKPFSYASGSGSRGHFTPDIPDKDDQKAGVRATLSSRSGFTRTAWPQGRKMATNKNTAMVKGPDGKLRPRKPKMRKTDAQTHD